MCAAAPPASPLARLGPPDLASAMGQNEEAAQLKKVHLTDDQLALVRPRVRRVFGGASRVG